MCCLDPNDFDENNYNNQKNCNNYNNVYITLPAMSLITAGIDTGKSCAIARWRRGGAGGGGACEGETSGVGGVCVPESSSQGSSTRSSSGTTVTKI